MFCPVPARSVAVFALSLVLATATLARTLAPARAQDGFAAANPLVSQARDPDRAAPL